MPLLRNGRIAVDGWSFAADDAPLPEGPATVSLQRFLGEADALLARNVGVGVRLAPPDDPRLLAPYLDRLQLIEATFPKYTDGRAFSQAQLLRRRMGYAGELRAVGQVLRDQLGYMARTGFDAQMIDHADPERAYAEATAEFSEAYQATADGAATVFQKRHSTSASGGGGGADGPAARVARLNEAVRGADAPSIIRAALAEFGAGNVTYVSSFGAESAAMLGLIADVDPDLPIVFIDTGMHFQQTLQYRDELSSVLGLTNVRTVKPDAAEVKAADPKGQLNKTDADACCEVRKVRPLEPALAGFSAWFTGRKRFHGGGRVNLPVAEFAGGRFKINPLANWGQEDIAGYLAKRNLPKHPMVAEGYPSIGCWPCTVRPVDPSDVRSGRWAGKSKEECGLHVERKDRPRVF